MCNLLAVKPLQEVVESGNTITKQAAALAAWARQSVLAALGLAAPPDADQDDGQAEEA